VNVVDKAVERVEKATPEKYNTKPTKFAAMGV